MEEIKKGDNNQCLPCGETSYSRKRTINSIHSTIRLHGGKRRHNHRRQEIDDKILGNLY